jgi:nucleoside 2-deoxyribosyltransferase
MPSSNYKDDEMKPANEFVLYLAGPINGRDDFDCKVWRDLVTMKWVGKTLDPMRRDYRSVTLGPEVAAEIVAGDLLDIRNSDALLVYFDQPSVGTSMEIFYAEHVLKKPVFIVNVSRKPVSPWLLHHSTVIFERLDEQTLIQIKQHMMAIYWD